MIYQGTWPIGQGVIGKKVEGIIWYGNDVTKFAMLPYRYLTSIMLKIRKSIKWKHIPKIMCLGKITQVDNTLSIIKNTDFKINAKNEMFNLHC